MEWKKLVGNDYNLILKLDGDYLHIYKNIVSEKNLLYTLVRTNKDTFAQIKKFVKKGTFDLSKVTWPRHADGSCDFDGSKKTTSTSHETKKQQYLILNKCFSKPNNARHRKPKAPFRRSNLNSSPYRNVSRHKSKNP